MSDSAALPRGWRRTFIGAETDERKERVGSYADPPTVLSSTKHHGLVPSDDFFRNRTVYSDDLSNYKSVSKNWFAYATNHLAEGSIGLQDRFINACVSPIYTVFSCREETDPTYLHRVLKSPELISQFKLHEQASVDRRGAVRYRDFAEIPLVLPSLAEQRRIAEILDSADEVIRSTEQLILKLNQTRQGVIYDLLASGLDQCDHAQTEHSSSLPDSVPKSWQVVPLRELYIEHPRNGLYKPPIFHGSGAPMVQMGQLFRDGPLDASDASRVRVSATERERFGLRRGDLLFGRRSLAFEGAGRCTVVDYIREPTTFESSLIRIRIDTSRLDPFLAALILATPEAIRDRRRYVRQVAVSGVTSGDVGNFLVAVPPISEQHEILATLGSYSRVISESLRSLAKLRLLKVGLTSDLLSGRTRVGVST
jgi:type I restriction enzyme, S subunit